MPIFAVTYTYDERTEQRDQHRAEHRAYLTGLLEAGVVLASGAFSDAARPGALLILRAQDEADVAAALDADPFAREGLVVGRQIRAWNPAMGPWAD